MSNREHGLGKVPLREIQSNPEYSFLPEGTRDFLSEYRYKDFQAVEVPSPGVDTGITFMIADMKVPTEGPAKVLEFGGVGSHLDAYPEGGRKALAQNVYETLGSFDLPVLIDVPPEPSVLSFRPKRRLYDEPPRPYLTTTMIGADLDAAKKYGLREAKNFTTELPLQKAAGVANIDQAHGIVWLQSNRRKADLVAANGFLPVNPSDVNDLGNDKLRLRNRFIERGLERFRPRSWVFFPEALDESVDGVLSATDAREFVLKPTTLSDGVGVLPISRDEFPARVSNLFSEARRQYPRRLERSIDDEIRSHTGQFLVEELVHSRAVISSKNGEAYDGTLRVVFMAATSQEKMAIIPVGGYWKLPSKPMNENIEPANVISNVNQMYPAEPVSSEDFAKGFETIVESLPVLLSQNKK